MANTTGKKYGGRKAGTPNKLTADIRQHFKDLLESNMNTLQSDLALLEPKDRIKALLEISRFVLPTLKAVELNTDTQTPYEPVIINFTSRSKEK